MELTGMLVPSFSAVQSSSEIVLLAGSGGNFELGAAMGRGFTFGLAWPRAKCAAPITHNALAAMKAMSLPTRITARESITRI